MADDKIVKIYDISTIGSDEVLADLEAINKQFVDIKKNKLSLNSLKASIEDPEELKKVDKELTNLLLKEKQLATELKQKQIQMKEYQLIAAAEREAKKKEAVGNTALAGSYNEVNKKYKELLTISKNSTNLLNPQEVQQAQMELKKYKDLLDNFNRGLTKDGTLVGEYTSGILQAFKNSGLDDVINDQLKKAKQNVIDLDAEFEQLKQELSNLQVTGNGSLQHIETQLIENRRAAQGFTDQINRVENELRTMNTTGSSIGSSIGLQFKNLKKDVVQFALGYASFQGLLQAGQTIVKQSVALDSLDRSLEEVSGSSQEFAKNQAYLTELSDRLGVSLLETSQVFKNFYASSTLAGISQNETRKIFEAATEASTVLKLSQEDTNGVLLAFGQIASKGKVQAEELRGQIGERLPGAFAIAAKAMGVTQAELNKMMEDGKLASNVFLPKFAEELKKTFSLGGKEATGLQATIGRVQTAITDFVSKNQESLSRSIDNLGKLAIVLLSVAQAITSIPFPLFIAGLSTSILLTNTWIGAKLRLVAAWTLEKGALIIENIQLAVNNAIKTTAIVVTMAYTTATIRMTAATGLSAIAIQALSAAFAFLTSPVGIVLGLTTALITVWGVMASKAETANSTIATLNQRIKDNAIASRVQSEAAEKINNTTKDTIALLKSKLDIAKNENITMATRKKAVEDIIAVDKQFFKGLTLQNLETKKSIDLIQAYINKLYDKAKAEAYAQLIMEKQKKVLEIQTKKDLLFAEFGNANGGITDNRSATPTNVMKTFFNDVLGTDFESGNPVEAMNKLNAELSKTNEELDYLNKLAEKNKDIQRALLGQNESGTVGAIVGGKGNNKASSLNGTQKDYLKDLEAARDIALAENDRKFTKGIVSEETYLTKIRDINVKFFNEKMAYLKGSNAEERKEIAEAKRDKEKIIRETNDKLFDLDVKAIDKKKKLQEDEINNEIQGIGSNKSLSESDKISKKIELDNKLIDLQIKYMDQVDQLEKYYHIASTDNAEQRAEALKEIQRVLNLDLEDLQLTSLNKLEDDQRESLERIKRSITARGIGILGDGSLNENQRQKKLKELERQGAKELEDERISQIDNEFIAYANMLDKKLLSQDDYNKKVSELETERLDLIKSSMERELQAEKEKNDEKEKVLQAGYKISEKFIDTYLKKLSMQVEADYNAVKTQLDLEKERKLELAQSAAEKQAIEEEYKAKSDAAERERNIARQEVARKQLAVEFALASIKAISTATSIYDGIAKEAIVAAEYLTALSLLNAQQFAFGGKVQPYNLSSGRINVGANITPTANGDNILAYVKKNEVILNEDQQAKLGGDSTFARIGVPGFASSSYYGSSVQPPVFRSYYTTSTTGNNNSNSNDIEEIKSVVFGLVKIIERESYKPVLLDTNNLKQHQDSQAKKVNLATV